MGKPLLIGIALLSLKIKMEMSHKKVLYRHVDALKEKINQLNWRSSPIFLDLIEDANELIDGTGYPNKKRYDSMSETVRLISIVKAVNKLTHERNKRAPMTTISAYKKINETECYDTPLLIVIY